MLKRRVNSFRVVTLDHTAREKIVLFPRTRNHAPAGRVRIPKTNRQIGSRVVVGGEMFERSRQRKQGRTRKAEPDTIATDQVAALDRTRYPLRRLKQVVDRLKVLDRSGRFFCACDVWRDNLGRRHFIDAKTSRIEITAADRAPAWATRRRRHRE